MPSHLESCIGFLQETCDTNAAYFSFTTDASGERGVIKANKDGLRLYAIELLKKSMEMEKTPAAENLLFFDDYDWLSEDAGYHLICGIAPTAASRTEILDQNRVERRIDAPRQKASKRLFDWFPSLIILSGGLIVATIAAFKWFH
jgi:hypothetical protein